MSCSCGAFKTYGSPKKGFLHSDWCHWSPNWVPKKCQNVAEVSTPDGYVYYKGYHMASESSTEECGKEATHWVQYVDAHGNKFNMCTECCRKALDGKEHVFDCGLL